MTSIYTSSVDREGLLACLAGAVPLRVRQVFDLSDVRRASRSRQENIELVWRGNPSPGTLPSAIVLDEEDLKEFVAFTSTYIATYSPFSAFFRVVSRRDLNFIAERIFDTRRKVQIPEVLVSVMIAEAFVQVGAQAKSIDDVSVQACFATLSSSIYRALIAGFDSASISEVARNWNVGRNLLVEEPLRLPGPIVREFWEIVSDAVSPNSLNQLSSQSIHLVEFVSSFLQQRQPNAIAWQRLTSDIPEFRDIVERMRGSREDRIRILDSSLAILRGAANLKRQVREALFGYLLSLLADGSLIYLGLSVEMAPDLTTVPLWYALFSSLSKGTDVLSIGGSLGRRLVRDLQTDVDLLGVPTADISITELAILASDYPKKLSFRTNLASSVDVEIFPAINARYRAKRLSSELSNNNVNKARMEEMRALAFRILDLATEAGRDSEPRRVSEPPGEDTLLSYRQPKKRPRR